MDINSSYKMDSKMDCFANDTFRKSLDTMRESRLFCDATIHIPGEEKTLPVHKAIMSSCSAFYRSLFTGSFKESSQHEVTIQGASFEIMELIVKYAYTNRVEISYDNVEEVFAAADRFSILGLLNDCLTFLVEETCAENCIGILRFARMYNNKELVVRTWRFILKHFVEIYTKSDEFLKLDADEFNELLREDKLKVESEDQVFESVMRWIDARPPTERMQHVSELLACVRFPYCSEEYLQKQITNRKDLKRGPHWDRLDLSHQFVKKCRFSRKPSVKSKARQVAKWIPPRIPHSVMFIIGGWGRSGVTDSVETYDRHMDQWFEVGECELESPRAYHGTAALNGKIYVIGGFNGFIYLNSVVCFDIGRKEWTEKAPMYNSRCYVTVGEIDGILYAVGGFDGRQRHNSVEKYEYTNNQWSLVAPMFQPRSDAGAATLKGKLYVAGGFDGSYCLATAEVYEPDINQWTVLAPMSKRRSGVSLAVCCDKVYAIGGYDGGSRRQRSVEVLDSGRYRHWCSAPRMIVGRSNCACTVVDNIIYVMGGYDGETTTAQVECFMSDKQKWEALNKMNYGRSAVSSCVIYDVENADDFTFHGNKEVEIRLGPVHNVKKKVSFSGRGDMGNSSSPLSMAGKGRGGREAEGKLTEEEALELAMAACLEQQ